MIAGIVVFVKLDIIKKVKDKLFTEPVHPLERIDTGDNDVQITYNHEVLKVSYTLTDDMQFSFLFLDKDNNDVPVGILDDQSGYFIDDSRYPRFSIKPLLSDDLYLFSITIDGRGFLQIIICSLDIITSINLGNRLRSTTMQNMHYQHP